MIKLKTYFLIASLLISPLIMASEGVANKVTLLSESDQTIDETHYPTTDYVHGKFEKKTVIVAVEANASTLTAAVGNYYNVGSTNGLAVTLPSITGATSVSSIVFFATMGVANALTFSAGQDIDVYYPDGYSLEANSTYEINCLWNGSAWVIATVKVTTSNS